MRAQLRELYKYRELLYMIVLRDIKVRYKQSVMGFLWAILMPVLIVSAGVLVRYAYGIASHKPLAMSDVVSVATKSIPWAFLVSSIKFSCQSLLANHNLVTKVYFPKEIFPIAAVLAQLFDLFIASLVLVILLVVAKVSLSLQLLWAGPLLALTDRFGDWRWTYRLRGQPIFPRRQVHRRGVSHLRHLLHPGVL